MRCCSLVEVGVQHVVRLFLLGEDRDGVPVVADRFQHRGAPTRLVERQVIGKVKVGQLGTPGVHFGTGEVSIA